MTLNQEVDILGLAYSLMFEHGVVDWHVRFVDEIRAGNGMDLAGHCNWNTQTIELSRLYVLDYERDRLFRVILHEIAHALTPDDKLHGVPFGLKFAELRVKEGLIG